MKNIGSTVKTLREEKGMTQQQVAELLGMHRTNYSKIEKGERDLSIEAVNIIAKFFGMTIDEIVNFNGKIPEEVTIIDKSLTEKIKLIASLDKGEQQAISKIIDAFLTKKKFKEFFEQQLSS